MWSLNVRIKLLMWQSPASESQWLQQSPYGPLALQGLSEGRREPGWPAGPKAAGLEVVSCRGWGAAVEVGVPQPLLEPPGAQQPEWETGAFKVNCTSTRMLNEVNHCSVSRHPESYWHSVGEPCWLWAILSISHWSNLCEQSTAWQRFKGRQLWTHKGCSEIVRSLTGAYQV